MKSQKLGGKRRIVRKRKTEKENTGGAENKEFNFNNCRLKRILIFLILFFVFVTFLMLFIYLSYGDDVLSLTKINATINVGDYIGFNLDKDKLHFGTAFPGGKSMRELSITPNEDGYVYVSVNQDFKDWMLVSVQNEPVEKGKTFYFRITMVVPENAPVGNYTFEMNVFILEKKADFITKSFLKSAPANYDLGNDENEGSGKIVLNIVNSSEIY